MNTAKPGIRLIAEICSKSGIRKVVLSPGSRSAPLAIAFSSRPDTACFVIPDERVAGYFALGMARQLQEPVAIICTSGTAVLNLAPAVCEAFYLKVPLLILTADRPPEMIGKGENQTIVQNGIYGANVKSSYALPCEPETAEQLQLTAEILHKAVSETMRNARGPVHINVPIREPLYEFSDEPAPSVVLPPQPNHDVARNTVLPVAFTEAWGKAGKKMIITGLHDPDENLQRILSDLSDDESLVVLTEPTSNLHSQHFINNYDNVLNLIESNSDAFVPEMVLTTGGQILSKKIRSFLKKQKHLQHWHVAPTHENWDIFGHLSGVLTADPAAVMEALKLTERRAEAWYQSLWQNANVKAQKRLGEFVNSAPFSDLTVYDSVLKHVPVNAQIHYGNSTPVRYASLLPHGAHLSVFANRGTSGIDGCLSTATGAARATDKPTLAILGDISFLYDSNALWNNYLSPNLRIIVINNGGGNIFRLIDGPVKVSNFEQLFETGHQLNFSHLAGMYGLTYYFCDNRNALDETLKHFWDNHHEKPALLEVKTNNELSAGVYKTCIEHLKKVSHE